MVKNLDDHLTLEQLFTRCDDLAPGLMVKIYYTPDVHFFYIRYSDVLPLFLPDNAYFLGMCNADNVHFIIETFIADAIYRLNKSLQS